MDGAEGWNRMGVKVGMEAGVGGGGRWDGEVELEWRRGGVESEYLQRSVEGEVYPKCWLVTELEGLRNYIIPSMKQATNNLHVDQTSPSSQDLSAPLRPLRYLISPSQTPHTLFRVQ